jgi:hypothetical protein
MSALDYDSRADETAFYGCPYCGKIIVTTKNRKTEELKYSCHKCANLGEWHEGVFRVEVLKVVRKYVKPSGKNLLGRYNLHCLGWGGVVDRVFFTFTEMDIRKGDLISISYKRVPRKVINKTWSGGYSENPSLLVNSRTRISYKI